MEDGRVNPESPYQPGQGPMQAMPPNPGSPQANPAPLPVPPPQPMQQPAPYSPSLGLPVSSTKKHHSWPLIIALVLFIMDYLSSTDFAFWASGEWPVYQYN